MKRRTLIFLILIINGLCGYAQERPNILFLVIEDTSPYLLPAYGNTYIKTPNIDLLARNGVVFTNAYSNAPYCSPARSSLISGSYATTYACDWHRNNNIVPLQYFFPQYLKQAGYFTVNAGKTDYNVTKEVQNKYYDMVWDKMSGYWKEGKPNVSYNDPERDGKPFFAQFNNLTTHMSRMTTVSVENREPSRINKDSIKLPPYVPNLSDIRSDYALHLEGVEDADKWVGFFIDDLKKRGLYENTIIFFFSDHGGCLPRGKAFPYTTGQKPALIISAPEKWKHLLPSRQGTQSNRLVEFTDFGPTLLSIAGIKPPDHLQGKAFMGKYEKPKRKYTFAFRTNTEDHFDPSRSVFDGNFEYIKYYTPYKIHGLRQSFQWGMPANLAWDSLYMSGNCPERFKQHFEAKPREMLFDTKKDPFCMKNLADNPEYQSAMSRFRNALSVHLKETKDLGFFPKDVRDWFVKNNLSIYTWVRQNNYDFNLLYDLINKASENDPSDISYFVKLIRNERPEIRFWAASGLAYLAKQGNLKSIPQQLYLSLNKEEFYSVSAVMAETLVEAGDQGRGLAALIDQAEKNSGFAFSSLEELRQSAKPVLPAIQKLAEKSENEITRFRARSILINFGLLPLSKLFEQYQIDNFVTHHLDRVEHWAPTLPNSYEPVN